MSRNIRLLCRCAWLLCGAIRFEIARKIEEQRRRVEPSVLWRYRCNLAGPSRQRTKRVDASGVCHLRYAVDPATPWRGVGPLQVAALAGKLSAELENALGGRGFWPSRLPAPDPKHGRPRRNCHYVALRYSKIPGAQFSSSRRGDFGAPGGTPSGAGWEPRRLGAEPPAALVNLQLAATNQILAACGVSPSLFSAQSAGAAREAWRQTRYSLLNPLGLLVEAELSRKLETEIELDWIKLAASDISGRARALQSLTGAGMPLAEASKHAGF